MSGWCVKIPDRLVPQIEEIGRQEYRKPTEVVRYLIEKSLVERAIGQGKRQQREQHETA